jgi:hypothetical protein
VAPDSFDHLRFTRLEQVNSKRKKGGFGVVVKPEDPQAMPRISSTSWRRPPTHSKASLGSIRACC